jgi:hypothetical protein
MIGINPDFDYLIDDQQKKSVAFCPVCGGEIFGDWICWRCYRRAVQEDE